MKSFSYFQVNQDKKQTEDLDQSELQPLRGTLQRLARQSVADELPSDSVIKGKHTQCSFKI